MTRAWTVARALVALVRHTKPAGEIETYLGTLTDPLQISFYQTLFSTLYTSTNFGWLLHNLVEASFDLFRYLLLGDQLILMLL